MRRAHGFTLIELLLVMLILGIVAGMAVSNVDHSELELETAAKQLAADLVTAQGLAIKSRLPVGLAADVKTSTTQFVLADGTPIAGAEARLRGLGTLTDLAVERLLGARPHGSAGFARIRIAAADFAGSPNLVFAADGTPSAGGSIQLVLGGKSLQVRCAPSSGRIAVTAP